MKSTAATLPTKSASASQGKAVVVARIPDPPPGGGKHRAKNRRRKKAQQRKRLAEETDKNKEQTEKLADRKANDEYGVEDEELRDEDEAEESDWTEGRENHEKGVTACQHNTDKKDAKAKFTRKERKQVKKKEAGRGGLVKITAREDGGDSSGIWYYYLKMILHSSSPAPQSTPPDLLTWRTFLTSSLTRLFGVQGASCVVDILKLDNWDCWVKVVGSDGDFGVGIGRGGFGVAVGGYVGTLTENESGNKRMISVRVVRGGRWLIGVVGGEESDLWAA